MPRVNLHVHSDRSDGALPPDALAAYLSGRGADYVALADHDRRDGAEAFRAALRGPGCVEAAEIACARGNGELHLLAYWSSRPEAPLPKGARGRKPQVADAIRAIRAGGGAAFLAHPLAYAPSARELSPLLDELAAAGLDGIEARYGPYPPETRDELAALAAAKGLATCAGTDLHTPGENGAEAWIDFPEAEWRAFRELLFSRSAARKADEVSRPATATRPLARFALRTTLPAAIAAAGFAFALFGVLLPRYGAQRLQAKKDAIREVTESAAGVLAEYAAEEAAGRLSGDRAKAEAVARIRDLRYGLDSKDYFWITDTTPRMIMHPYRPELDGAFLGGFMDERGKRVFVEFVEAVKDADEGYVEYLWQWKDDETRISPKLSYVMKFRPWDWIIGTGVYLDDMDAEIAALTGDLVWFMLAVSSALALALVFLVREGLKAERSRLAAERETMLSRERYRALAEASGEGTALVVDGRCAFANPAFLAMTGYAGGELELVPPPELFSPWPDAPDDARDFIESLRPSAEPLPPPAGPFECSIPLRGGGVLDALAVAVAVEVGGRPGLAFTVREGRKLGGPRDAATGVEAPGAETERPSGTFLAKLDRRGTFEEIEAAAKALFLARGDGGAAGLFSSLAPADAERLREELRSRGMVSRFRASIERSGEPSRELCLTAVVTRGRDGGEARAVGFVEDGEEGAREERERAELGADAASGEIAALAPVISVARPAPVRGLRARIGDLAAELADSGSQAVVLVDDTGRPAGVVAARDLVREMASAVGERVESLPPATSVGPETSVCDAIAELERSGRDYVAIRRADGTFAGLAGWRELAMPFLLSETVAETRIAAARSMSALAAARAETARAIERLAALGASPAALARRYSRCHDAVVRRLRDMARDELGAEPGPWVWLAMGSAARREALPGSDRDSALVFHSDADGEARSWFARFAAFVDAGLDRAGFPPCPGGVLATSADWRLDADEWRAKARGLCAEPSEKAQLSLQCMCDARTVAGHSSLASAAEGAGWDALAAAPAARAAIAASAASARIPASPPRSREEEKEARAVLARLARSWVMVRLVRAAGTVERIRALSDAGAFSSADAEGYAEAWTDLLALGLCTKGTRADALARVALARAATMQRALSWDIAGFLATS